MIEKAVIKKITNLESKIKDIESHLISIADSIKYLAREQRKMNGKLQEMYKILDNINFGD